MICLWHSIHMANMCWRRWRRQILDSEKRENAAEKRCQDLEGMVPRATQPLLRQIEALQRSQDEQSDVWQEIEKNLRARLQAAETAAAVATERATVAQEKVSTELAKVAQLAERATSTGAHLACGVTLQCGDILL